MDKKKCRKFGPKTADHPSCGELCPACKKPFEVGDFTTLISLGPGGNENARKKMREGRFYTAVAIELHFDCADPNVSW